MDDDDAFLYGDAADETPAQAAGTDTGASAIASVPSGQAQSGVGQSGTAEAGANAGGAATSKLSDAMAA